ncbi:SIMPL domain-containing protein, partial [Candidatus Peregrinibacteria bacterium]|nr:SIMPL domain-containing protein [Candidatus Peregrinibacteria bacterium]
ITPVYKWGSDYELPPLVGYRVNKTVQVILKDGDVAKFEKLASRAVEVGANQIFNVEFKTTKLREYRDKARKMAMKAAKEKADLLAGELGQKVRKAISISEGKSGWYSPYNWWGQWGRRSNSYLSQNVQQSMPQGGGGAGTDDSETATTFSIGQISVNASVTVTFEIAD